MLKSVEENTFAAAFFDEWGGGGIFSSGCDSRSCPTLVSVDDDAMLLLLLQIRYGAGVDDAAYHTDPLEYGTFLTSLSLTIVRGATNSCISQFYPSTISR